MAAQRKDLGAVARGRWGEDLVARRYEREGYSIVERNWRCAAGEIDLIVRRGDVVVFCEVKARRSARYGPAAAAVDWRKQRRIRGLAARWLRESGAGGVVVRFDVATVTGVRLDIIASAF